MPKGVYDRSKQSDKSPSPFAEVEWSRRADRLPFGHRLDFLSPEKQHLNTGKLKILPPLNHKGRKRGDTS